ncbi:proteasome assembly chaperone family protein [Sulfolobus sp. E5-1-F]|uniref:proteasome assembly chaperone family protein n=1 Tax=Sulfolobaceae TaxID=118883 RepID=UPI001296F6E1|nr:MULTISPECIES: proteasome assembly chaperone family protein [unclassified Sulfolobus]QGA54927.1 proteasome assembly chaperone family protein [Sulfolobus sp. E5-1-F]QGA67759.1 proteasome assembly chaperone family protein [Sulfolobus sp. E11-6]
MSNVKIIIKKDLSELKGSTFITGFRTIGEVGYLATRHLALKRKMERIGYVVTKYYRDVTFVDDYGIATPFDIFYDKDKHLVLLLNHILPFQREWNDFASEVIKWVKKLSINNILLVGALDKRYKVGNESLKWLKTSKCNLNLDYPQLDKQLLMVGPLALFTLHSEIEDLPALVLLPYADRERTDPVAAAIAIEVLNKMLSLNVSVDELYEEAKRIEEDLQKQMELLQKELSRGSADRVYM